MLLDYRTENLTRPARRWPWLALIALLIAIRLPSLVQPAGGDQSLYAYAGQRILAGDVMYRDVWDQKPPGIEFTYALLDAVWPHQSVVPGTDLLIAIATAALLIAIGRRRYTADVGYGAAAVFLLFGDPYLQRMSGVYVRAQCEPFVALAVAAGLAILAARTRTRVHLVVAGVTLALAFWLKYAAMYALPALVAVWVWSPDSGRDRREFTGDVIWLGIGFFVACAIVLAYFAVNGALTDLRLATIDYNLRYSQETYDGPAGILRYLLTFPLARARVDMLWFLGGIGTLLLVSDARARRSSAVALSWLVAAVFSIAINGARDLPNYFVQAAPALALVAATGLSSLPTRRTWVRFAIAALLVAGIWRVGSDAPVGGFRFASLPGLVDNVRHDLAYARGRIDRETYLLRFQGQKHFPLENERLAQYVRDTSAPGDPIYVFGFSGGAVCWLSGRQSSSRFFWSRPVLIEFGANRPGYGSQGLLRDLQRVPPTIVALQKDEWRSRGFFLGNDRLRRWLEEGYRLDHDTPMFSVWRRRS